MKKLMCCGDLRSGCANPEGYQPTDIFCSACSRGEIVFKQGEMLVFDGNNLAVIQQVAGRHVYLRFRKTIPQCFKSGTEVFIKRYQLNPVSISGKTVCLEVVSPLVHYLNSISGCPSPERREG